MILPRFRLIGKHAINLLSGIYLASAIAGGIGRFFPSLRVATFIVLSVSWVLTGIAVMMREAEGNRESLTILGIETLPPVIVGCAVVVLIARVVANYLPSDPGYQFSLLILEWGIPFWIVGYLTVMRDAYHKKKLDEDLANKPDTTKDSSNHSLQPTAGPSDD
jgi:ABC-type transport system involved in multi-copper enzyme maturation permease subunit